MCVFCINMDSTSTTSASEMSVPELSCPPVQGDFELPELNLEYMDSIWPSTDETIELDKETMAWVAELSHPQTVDKQLADQKRQDEDQTTEVLQTTADDDVQTSSTAPIQPAGAEAGNESPLITVDSLFTPVIEDVKADLTCKNCMKLFKQAVCLKRHKRVCKGLDHWRKSCKYCGKTFPRIYNRKDHEKNGVCLKKKKV